MSDKPREYRTVEIPISDTKWVTIRLPCKMSEEAWRQMQNVLSAMKPAFTDPFLAAPPTAEQRGGAA